VENNNDKPVNELSRRQLLKAMTALGLVALTASAMAPSAVSAQAGDIGPYPDGWLPTGIRSRFVNDINGLRIHVLEAGFETEGRPALVLLHGFPELAYSWRKVMVPLAAAGYHVIAPDLRGYGRTTGWDGDYDGDLASFRRLNVVRDVHGLVSAFGYRSVAAVIGHDFGSPVAAWCAVTRPDIFRAVVLMSAPFGGTQQLPFDTADNAPRARSTPGPNIYEQLAALPQPRKHYQRYYNTREANENMWHAPQGIHAFIRGYYHYKSADWEGNRPHRLAERSAEEWAKMPTYYIMDLDQGMAETVAEVMPSAAEIAANQWLPDAELEVYAEEYGRNSFQGGLQHYRSGGIGAPEQQLYAGRTIDQPSMFISGASDWGSYQSPGALERMQQSTCTDMRAVHMVDGAGHWVQQEQGEETSKLLIEFLSSLG
jgi:pimeloyl-ACP methyl ester carboxylesterase|tara:strand:- start:45 stop:1325 length:1281 start_codon:yes stop_codon:yes gene_type:complete